MMLRQNLTLILTAVLITGCSSVGPDGQPVPRYGNRLNVTSYSTTAYPSTTELDIYEWEQTIPPHKIIAMISREGHPRDEGLIMNAIAWKARMLGAHAIVRLPLRDPQTHFSAVHLNNFSSAKTESAQPVWRVNAIRYTPSATNASTLPTASKPASADATR